MDWSASGQYAECQNLKFLTIYDKFYKFRIIYWKNEEVRWPLTSQESQRLLTRIAALRQKLLTVAALTDTLTDPKVLACSQALDHAIGEWYSMHHCQGLTKIS